MQFDNHETDLYILPETKEEEKNLISILENNFSQWDYYWQYSDVQGQAWYKKKFIKIPFGIDLKEEIINLLK